MAKNNLLFASAVVLCGGASSRMGFDKSLIHLGDGWLLDAIFEQLLSIFPQVMGVGECAYTKDDNLNVQRSERVEKALLTQQLQFYKDLELGKGPMSGLLEALKKSESPFVYMTACDMPRVSLNHIEHLKKVALENPQGEIILGTVAGRIEPFQALYRKNLESRAVDLMTQNRLSLKALMDGCPEGAFIKVPIQENNADVYFNINDQDHLKTYLRSLPVIR